MKVVVHPADKGGCGMYRLIWPALALRAQGHKVRIAFDHAYKAIWQPGVFGDRIVGLASRVDADVVVLQRPLTRNRVELIDALQAEGIAVVVEIDDDFHAVHPRNPAWTGSNPLQNPEHNRDWLAKACRRADLVTVSTPALAKRYGEHGRVAVVRNRVPEKYVTLNGGDYTEHYLERPAGTLVGWSGSVATHPDDLQVTGGAIPDALDGAEFLVVGTGKNVADRLGLRDEPHATGWLPILAYPEGLQLLDVGIVPLAPTNFNDAKSALKGLEMAAVGVPYVASPTAEYRHLAEQGVGWIAETPDDWATLVRELVVDPVHREHVSLTWRDEIAAHHTIEGHAHEWWEAWGLAVENAARREAA